MCMFCRPLFVLLYFFFLPLCCLYFFDIRILIYTITPLVSSNSSYKKFFSEDMPIYTLLKSVPAYYEKWYWQLDFGFSWLLFPYYILLYTI